MEADDHARTEDVIKEAVSLAEQLDQTVKELVSLLRQYNPKENSSA